VYERIGSAFYRLYRETNNLKRNSYNSTARITLPYLILENHSTTLNKVHWLLRVYNSCNRCFDVVFSSISTAQIFI